MAKLRWAALIPIAVVYFTGLPAAGLLGPDEPRYASIGREMARSGDWITPRLWGQPWFEKPALLYWMTGAAFRLGLHEDLAPRLPVALCSVAFLIFLCWIVRREFGTRTAWSACLILGTGGAWIGYSYIGVTDLPMAAAFSAAMLLSLEWIDGGSARRLPAAAALLGVAVLAKGLVPLVLTLPLLWCGRRRWRDLLRPSVCAAFAVVALPWYLLCYGRNGTIFLRTFFWEQHFERFASPALQHVQPMWFYVPVLLGSLLPWTPLLVLLARRSLYIDARRRFLLLWLLFGLAFFTLSKNKLPGYLLPLLPAAAILMASALTERSRMRWPLPLAALSLIAIPLAIPVLPRALTDGITRAPIPALHWSWFLPVALAVGVYSLERKGRSDAAVAAVALAAAAGILIVKAVDLPWIDREVSARPLWSAVAGERDRICVDNLQRSWRYGLNYYSITPLPDCAQSPLPIHLQQTPGHPPVIAAAPARP